MKYFIQTFGCKVSQYESQAIREAWNAKFNGEEVESPDKADILLIASCAVTREGVTDARQLCNKWRKNYPQACVLVTGCAAEIAQEDFKNAHALIAQKRRDILLIHSPLELSGYYAPEKKLVYPAFEIKDFKRSRPIIKVQDGCSHLCSYCIVPFCRGGSRSRPIENIFTEISTLLEKGFREFVLSGVNLRQYSYNGLDFWDILTLLQEKFAPEWAGKARFRLSSLEPAQLNSKGIHSLTLSSMVAPHIHLSLQSGSQTVLKRMEREHYSLADIDKALDELSKKWSLFGLGADFLLGFPEESEKEFQETLHFIHNIALTYAHVFPYSPRPLTKAAKYSGQIPKEIKKERSALVRSLIQEKQNLFLNKVCKEKQLLLSLDINNTQEQEKLRLNALDQYYNNCSIDIDSSLEGHELIQAKGIEIKNGTIKALAIL